ncbi:MAG: type II and III secretion system protein family protein [Bryobacteraceae bacterium]
MIAALLVMAAGLESVTLSVGGSAVLDVPEGVARISVSSPEVADAFAASAREVLLQAKAPGSANVVIWPKTGARRHYNVTVQPDLEPLRKLLRETFPGEQIEVRATRESLALVGRVSSQAVADRALQLAASAVKGAVSNLQAAPPAVERQVLLRVKFAEVNRAASSAFGVNLLSTGAGNTPASAGTGQFPSGALDEISGRIPGKLGGTATTWSLSDVLNVFAFRPDLNLGVLIRDLQTRGLLQILAEPNLVASNGKEASFLVGGEFPVPVVQSGASAGAVTVQFREFGIRLAFTPLLTTNRTVKLHVKPEVSTIDPTNGVQVSGFLIPALATRRMETDIELAEGQTFAIAGLIDDRAVENLSRVPGLSSIPVLGALFRSRSLTKNKTELIVMVTPESAVPAAAPPPGPEMPVPFLKP